MPSATRSAGSERPPSTRPSPRTAATPRGRSKPVCMLLGGTKPFSEQRLLELYPTHDDYIRQVAASAKSARELDLVLPEEEANFNANAVSAPIPR
jgi:hypothetical protein